MSGTPPLALGAGGKKGRAEPQVAHGLHHVWTAHTRREREERGARARMWHDALAVVASFARLAKLRGHESSTRAHHDQITNPLAWGEGTEPRPEFSFHFNRRTAPQVSYA